MIMKRLLTVLVALIASFALLLPQTAFAAYEADYPERAWQGTNDYIWGMGDSVFQQCGEDFGVGWRSLGFIGWPGATTTMMRERLQGGPIPADMQWTVTEPSRQDEYTWFRDAGQLVIALGVNDSKVMTKAQYRAEIDWFMEQSRDGIRPVIWINSHDATNPARVKPFNDALNEAANYYSMLKVVDWDKFATDNPQYTRGDGVHLADGPACDAREALIRNAVAGVVNDTKPRGYWYGTQMVGNEFIFNGWGSAWTNPWWDRPEVNVRVNYQHYGRWPVTGARNDDPWAQGANGWTWSFKMARWGGTKTVCLDLVDSQGRFTALGCRTV